MLKENLECLRKISLSRVENQQELKPCTLSLELEFNPGHISGKKMKDVGSEGEKNMVGGTINKIFQESS